MTYTYRNIEHLPDTPRREDSAGPTMSVEGSYGPQAFGPGHVAYTRLKNLKEIRKLGATDFFGTTDPAEAEGWLRRIERIFFMMDSTPEDKFEYAISLLQGNAFNWWETVPNALARPAVLTWDDFLYEFKEKYTPEVYRDQKQREFFNLKQGSMTVAEYELRFTQLSRYAGSLASSDRDKWHRYEEGLRWEIKSHITSYDTRSFADLRAAAIKAERLVGERPPFVPKPKRDGAGFTEEAGSSRKRSFRRPFVSSGSQGRSQRSLGGSYAGYQGGGSFHHSGSGRW